MFNQPVLVPDSYFQNLVNDNAKMKEELVYQSKQIQGLKMDIAKERRSIDSEYVHVNDKYEIMKLTIFSNKATKRHTINLDMMSFFVDIIKSSFPVQYIETIKEDFSNRKFY